MLLKKTLLYLLAHCSGSLSISLFLAFHLRLVATPHMQAHAWLTRALATKKSKRETLECAHFADRTYCIASTSLHLMYET